MKDREISLFRLSLKTVLTNYEQKDVFEIGDGVINLNLPPANCPISGGFPWDRSDVAIVVGVNGADISVLFPGQDKFNPTPYTYHSTQLLIVSK